MKKQELRKYLQKEIISVLKEQEVKNSPIQELEDQIVSFIEEYQQEYDVMEELSELLLSTHNQINREILDEASKEIVSILKEQENESQIKVGDLVTIPHDLTTDPKNMQGDSGTVEYINHNTVVVDFPSGVIGLYDVDIFNNLDEASEEEVKNQKELNKELEKTANIKKQIDPELNEAQDDDEFDIEDKEPTSRDINKNDSIIKLGNKLANVTKEMKELAKKWKEASDKDKPKIVGKLKDLTKVKKELEKFLDLKDDDDNI